MTRLAEKVKYGDYVLECNGMDRDGFVEWVFLPGMLFGSCERWWGRGGARGKPHEGLDFAQFRDGTGQVRRLNVGTLVPAMYGGEVVRVGEDYLGETVYLRHWIDDGCGRTLHTVYGHVRVRGDHRRLASVGAGEVLGSIADPGARDRKVPAHLHVTAAWIPNSLIAERLTWVTVAALGMGEILDPLDLMACRSAVEKLPREM